MESDILKAKYQEEIKTKLDWVIGIRWIFMVFVALMLLFFYQAFLKYQLFQIVSILLTVEVILNVIYYLISGQRFKEYLVFALVLFSSLIIDAFCIGFFLLKARLIGNFSGLIFTVPIIIGSFVFSLPVSLIFTFIVALIYYFLLHFSLSSGLINQVIFAQELATVVFLFITNFYVSYLSALSREQNHKLWKLQAEIIKKNNEIFLTQQQIIKTERLAIITEVAMGLDEEINGPITVILGFLYYLKTKTSQKKLNSQDISQIKEIFLQIIEQVKRIKETMNNLEKLRKKELNFT